MTEQATVAVEHEVDGRRPPELEAIERALGVVDRLCGPPQCFVYARAELKTLRLKEAAFDAILKEYEKLDGFTAFGADCVLIVSVALEKMKGGR